MNKLIFTLSLVAAMLLGACTGNKKNDANGNGNDSATAKKDSAMLYVEEEDKTDYSKFIEPPTRIDTVVGDWEIHVRQVYDGSKFKVGKDVYPYYALKCNVFKAGKPVFKDYKLDTKAIAGSYYAKEMYLGLDSEPVITETSIYLALSYFIPETDDGTAFMLVLCADGKVRKSEISLISADGSMEGYVYDINTFYAMYVNELSQPTPNAAAIQKVLSKYCTKGFAQKMHNKTIKNNPLLGPGKFDYQWLRSLGIHDKGEDNSCIIEFGMPGGKKVYKRLFLQRKPRTEYDFIISGVTDATADEVPSTLGEGEGDEEYEGDV